MHVFKVIIIIIIISREVCLLLFFALSKISLRLARVEFVFYPDFLLFFLCLDFPPQEAILEVSLYLSAGFGTFLTKFHAYSVRNSIVAIATFDLRAHICIAKNKFVAYIRLR
jgi:hypothetical protein